MRTPTTALAALLGLAMAAPALGQAPVSMPVSGPPDWAGFKAHADKAKALAGDEWKAAAEYFCSPGVRVNLISDPEIAPTRLFDNVWALGDEGTTVYAVTTPDGGIVLIDALYPDKYEKTLLPQMAKAGLDPAKVKYVLITHGHADHFGDTMAIAKRTGAKVVAITEIADEINSSGEGVEAIDTNLGGTAEFDWGSVRLVPALHTSTTPNGTVSVPAGLVVEIGDKRVYHLGDTALFSDLALPKRRGHIDVALMCIGGHYTMDRFDAVVAAEFVGADQVIPCHYDTFPPIETDAEAFKGDVESSTGASVVILAPGESHAV